MAVSCFSGWRPFGFTRARDLDPQVIPHNFWDLVRRQWTPVERRRRKR